MTTEAPAASPFRQPRAVYAVAFACVGSFMGIGLVDPILPAISSDLDATPSQVTLLFTSYLVVTAVAMLVTNWVSSRIGAKRTLIAGLALIVVFAAPAGASDSIGGIVGIVGFRAGWGVGNALFIGINNTVTTQAVMTVSPVDRPLACWSSASRSLTTARTALADAERVQAGQTVRRRRRRR